MTETELLIHELEDERARARSVKARIGQTVGGRRQLLLDRLGEHERRIALILHRFWHGNDMRPSGSNSARSFAVR
jgi:hypothetical protein